jgi:uncharacterized membrane protein
MKSLAEFTKTTLIGGLLVVVPVYFTALPLVKAATGLLKLIEPVTALLPDSLQHLRYVAAIVAILALCFVLGLVARTRIGRWAMGGFERAVLEKIPGFAMLRGVVRRVSGVSDDAMFQPVLVEIEDALTLAFIVEELDDGRYVVLVPSVPTPAAGSLYILTRERVHWVDASVTEAVSVITRWGSGAGKLVKSMR